MVLLGVDFTPLAEKLEELLEEHGTVDIVCLDRVYGVLLPSKIIRVRRNDPTRRIDEALLQTLFCSMVELKVIQ